MKHHKFSQNRIKKSALLSRYPNTNGTSAKKLRNLTNQQLNKNIEHNNTLKILAHDLVNLIISKKLIQMLNAIKDDSINPVNFELLNGHFNLLEMQTISKRSSLILKAFMRIKFQFM